MTLGVAAYIWYRRKRRRQAKRGGALPPLLWDDMRSWPDPYGRPTAAQVHAAREPEVRYVIVRARDQKAWAGPWHADGLRFTSRDEAWYAYERREDAEYALLCNNFPDRVTVEEYTSAS